MTVGELSISSGSPGLTRVAHFLLRQDPDGPVSPELQALALPWEKRPLVFLCLSLVLSLSPSCYTHEELCLKGPGKPVGVLWLV